MKASLVATFGLTLSVSAMAQISPLQNYLASIVPKNKVVASYNKMRTETKRRSQCFNRAYVWSHELLKFDNIHSKKILIYYTNKFRADLDPKWGFHIAPMVVMENRIEEGARAPYPTELSDVANLDLVGKYYGGIEDTEITNKIYDSNDGRIMNVVLDREFTQAPLNIHQWTRNLVRYAEQKLEYKRQKLVYEIKKLENDLNRSRQSAEEISEIKSKLREKQAEMKRRNVTVDKPAEIKCKMVEHISTFDELNLLGENGPEYCLLQVVSMNYWNTVDIRQLAEENIESTALTPERLFTARNQAFENAKEIWPTNKAIEEKISDAVKAIEKKFEKQIEIIEDSYKAKIKTTMTDLKKMQKENPSNLSGIKTLEARLNDLELKKADSVTKLENAKNAEIQAVYSKRTDLEAISSI